MQVDSVWNTDNRFKPVEESCLQPLSSRIQACIIATVIFVVAVVFNFPANADTIALVGTMTTSANFQDVISLQVPAGLHSLTVRIPVPQSQSVFGLTQTTKSVVVEAHPEANEASFEYDTYGNKYQVETFIDPSAGRYSFDLTVPGVSESADITTPLPSVQIAEINPPTDVLQFTEATGQIQSNDPQIAMIAHALETDSTDEARVAENIQRWLQKNIDYDDTNYNENQDASTVLLRKIGACDGWSQLFIAMARADGIPARFVGGYSFGGRIVYPKDGEGNETLTVAYTDESHAWAEVWYPHLGWVPYEPQISAGFVDTHRLKVWDGLDSQSTKELVSWTTYSPKQVVISTTENQKPTKVSDTISVNCDKVDTVDRNKISLARLIGTGSH